MKLENFHAAIVDWNRDSDREALQSIRQQIFVLEQHVTEERERDGLDPECSHVLARDEAGRPIGCGRLTPDRKIGRMAVLREWRNSGVGAALLRELIAHCRALGWPEVALAAQISARDFYARAGFLAYGEVFEDAGLLHQSMRLVLPISARPSSTPKDTDTLPAGNREEIAAARRRLLGDARHQLCIHLPVLGADSYAAAEELDELQRLALSGRHARIRLLLHDPAAALRDDHRLVALAQRLPSTIQIRMPAPDAESCPWAYLLNDVDGYLLQPQADQPQGRAAGHGPAGHAPLQRRFDEAWDRAEPATILQALNI
jgi:predicted GNAT family N-acyltransferase